MFNMIKIRFSDYKRHVILASTRRERRKEPMMSTKKTQVMTCGACAVTVNGNGQATTSIDALVNGVKHLASKLSRR